MKTKFLFIVAALIAPVVFAQQPAPQIPLVETNGSAEIRVVPDLADLSFEVEVRGEDLTIARKQQAERTTKVLAALRAAGVSEAELQSSQVQITPDYTDRRQETEKVRFYRISQNIGCTLHEVKKVPDVTAAAVEAGATGVHEARLRTSELRKYRDEARAKAVRAAKEKATALATELGVKIGKPFAITEDSNYSTSLNYTNTISFEVPQPDNTTASTFAPGTISISAKVAVSFVLE